MMINDWLCFIKKKINNNAEMIRTMILKMIMMMRVWVNTSQVVSCFLVNNALFSI